MTTDALIRTLAQDTRTAPPLGVLLSVAVALPLLAAGVAFLAGMGVRPDLAAALDHASVIVKHAFPVLLMLGGVAASLTLARPEARPEPALAALAAGPVLLAVAVAVEAVTVPLDAWGRAIFVPSLWVCLGFVPLMALPVLFASLAVLRRGASTQPRLSGAVAGLMSGGAAASVYAFYCTQDSPLFYGVWYVAGIAGVTALGAALGGRLLRW